MTKTKLKDELIEEIISKGSQSVSYREIYKHDNFKIKLEIKSDAFDMQSYARAYVLKDLEWSLIYSIPYSKMVTPFNIICRMMTDTEYKKLFIQDRDKLKKEIETILSWQEQRKKLRNYLYKL